AYTVRPSSLTATCTGTTGTCWVKGTMSWKFNTDKTTSHGAASFEYSVVLNDAGAKIAAETSSVNEVPPAPSSLGQVGRSIQQLLAKLSKPAPAKAPTKAAPKASTQTSTQASTQTSTQTQAAARPKAPVPVR